MYIKPQRSLLSIPRWQAILIALVLILAFGLMGSMDKEEEERQQTQYCEMVKLYKETNGQAGWPAYNGEGACK
jgi:hypothetical protein